MSLLGIDVELDPKLEGPLKAVHAMALDWLAQAEQVGNRLLDKTSDHALAIVEETFNRIDNVTGKMMGWTSGDVDIRWGRK